MRHNDDQKEPTHQSGNPVVVFYEFDAFLELLTVEDVLYDLEELGGSKDADDFGDADHPDQ